MRTAKLVAPDDDLWISLLVETLFARRLLMLRKPSEWKDVLIDVPEPIAAAFRFGVWAKRQLSLYHRPLETRRWTKNEEQLAANRATKMSEQRKLSSRQRRTRRRRLQNYIARRSLSTSQAAEQSVRNIAEDTDLDCISRDRRSTNTCSKIDLRTYVASVLSRSTVISSNSSLSLPRFGQRFNQLLGMNFHRMHRDTDNKPRIRKRSSKGAPWLNFVHF